MLILWSVQIIVTIAIISSIINSPNYVFFSSDKPGTSHQNSLIKTTTLYGMLKTWNTPDLKKPRTLLKQNFKLKMSEC